VLPAALSVLVPAVSPLLDSDFAVSPLFPEGVVEDESDFPFCA
jgi:hypothetical protein